MRTSLRLALFVLFISPVLALAQQTELEIAEARLIAVEQEYILDGVIEAINQATLSAEVAGRIEEVYFDIDDIVQEGEVLVRIRDNEYRAQLAQSKAALAEAKSVFENAEREFKRINGLYRDKVVSKAQFDQSQAALESSRARVTSAEANARRSQLQLSNTVIKAPYSGVVTARHVEPGELTNVGQRIMSGYALGELRVNVDVPQSIINSVREFRKARVMPLDQQPSISADQLIISPVADDKSHAFRVRVNLPAQTSQLFPGMLVKTAFVVDQIDRLLVPLQSVVRRSEVVAVYVVNKEGEIEFRQVRTGVVKDDQVEIVSGLESGEQVAIDPVQAGIQLKAKWAQQ